MELIDNINRLLGDDLKRALKPGARLKARDPVEERYELDIFTAGQTKQDFSNSGAKLDRHIYDYVLTDSNTEREFVKVLDTASEVVVYANFDKLRGLVK